MPNVFSKMWNLNNSSQNNIPQTNVINIQQGDDSIQKNETYHEYGLRICGRVTGSLPALTPYLSKIYNEEKRAQQQDEATHARLKQKLQDDITQINGEIAKKENQKSGYDAQIESLQAKESDLKERLCKAKAKDGEINKMARVKFIIGSLILLLLTVYLFIFYSSTFYSAFLYEPDAHSDISLGAAMLNSSALSEAFQLGFGSFIFIITAPIIFLGLGYSLHFFMVQKNKTKWFKIAALLFITVTFDCILAYKIGELMYNAWAETVWYDVPKFNISMAVRDINFWAVIFCGFIVYLIWGIVFDMIMTAYDELRSNKHEIAQLESDISDCQTKQNEVKQNIITADGEIGALINKREGLNNQINNSMLVDYSKIRTALSDFFAGWVSMMSALGHTSEKQSSAKTTYDDTMRQLFPN